MEQLLKVTTESENGNEVCFSAEGEITVLEANFLESKLADALLDRAGLIKLNMARIKYLSSAGVRVLLSTYKKAKKQGKTFKIISPSECVRNVLGMSALDSLM